MANGNPLELAGYSLGKQGFSCTSGPHHYDVALLDINIIAGLGQTLVVVIHSHRQILLGIILSHHVAVQEFAYLSRSRNLFLRLLLAVFLALAGTGTMLTLGKIILEQTLDLVDAITAYVSVAERTWHQYIGVGRLLPAEGARHLLTVIIVIIVATFLSHYFFSGRSILSIIP